MMLCEMCDFSSRGEMELHRNLTMLSRCSGLAARIVSSVRFSLVCTE